MKTLFAKQSINDDLTINDLLIARQIVRGAYLRNEISLDAVMKSEMQSAREINIKRLTVASVKLQGYIRDLKS